MPETNKHLYIRTLREIADNEHQTGHIAHDLRLQEAADEKSEVPA